jgi:hypothetical protein
VATLARLIVQIGASTAEFESAIKRTSTDLKNFQRDTKGLEPIMNAVGTAIKVVGTAIIGAFVAGGTAAIVSAAKIEQYRISLDTLMHSSQAAGETVAAAIDLASKTPFTDEQLLAASVALEKFGQDARTVLPEVASMAAATGGDVAAAAESYGRFLLGQTKALNTYGINKAAVLAEGAKVEQGIQIANQKGQIVNEAAYNKALLALMDEKFGAAAAKQANSISGLKTRLKDAADDALRTIAGVTSSGEILAGGLADYFKQAVTMIIAKIDEWKANGSLQKWAGDVGKAIEVFFTDAKIVFTWLVDIATWIAQNWQAIVPVIGAVVGAFVAFKAVTIYVDVAAVAVKLFGAAVAGTLGPLGWIMAAVAALSAVVVIATEKWSAYNAVMNPKLTTASSTANIQALKAELAQFDKLTKQNYNTMLADGHSTQDQITAYEAARAADRLVIAKKLQENIDGVNAAARDKQSTAQSDAIAEQKRKADEAAAAIATAEKLQRDAKTAAEKTAADKALKAAQTLAAEVLKTNADLDDQLYKLSHTLVEGQIYDLAKARDAAIAAGGSKLVADKIYVLAAKKVYADAAAAQLIADNEAADKALQAKKDAEDKYLSALADYTSKQQDVRSSLARTIIDNYGRQEDVAVTALEKERDAAIDTINDQIDARNKELEVALDNISKEKDAALGIFDVQISALEAAHAAAQRAETVAGLRADIATAALAMQKAETPEEKARASQDLLRAQKALDKELANEAYNDKLDSLRQQKAAASDFWDAQTKAAQTVAASDLQVLKDQVTATQKSYDDRLTSVKSYYADLMLQRNADAEAEKLLATSTQSDILAMLTVRLDEWKTLGAQISDAMFGDALRAKAALLGLTATPVPGTETPTSPTWNQGAGQAGYGNFPVAVHAAGGYFTKPHIALIAEKGPEMVIPQSQAGKFAGQMGGMPVNVTYNIAAADPAGIQNELRQHDKELLSMLRGGRW